MPIYTFACPTGHVSDHLLPLADRADPQICPACGQPSARKLESQIAHRMRKHGVMHIPGYQPARLSHEQAQDYSNENGF